MIDDDVIGRLVELHDHIQAPPTTPGADAARGQRILRRRRAVAAAAAAAAVVAVVGVIAVATGGPRAEDRIEPVRPAPTEWPLERIRAEGRVEHEQVTSSGMTIRTYVLCDGSPECSPHTDGPIRRGHEHYALEVSQDTRSALFRIGNSDLTVATAYDDTTVLLMDPLDPLGDPLDPAQDSFRLVRADGTQIELRMDSTPAAAAPGPGVVLVNPYPIDPDNDSVASQLVLVVDAGAGTVRTLEPPGIIDLRRTWGPDVDQFLWFVTFDCDVHFWASDGTFQSRGGGCTEGFDPGHYRTDENGMPTDEYGNPGNGDLTWVNADWFPDGWLEPGRMAFLERNYDGRGDPRLVLHVTLDQGATWQLFPVSEESAIPDALRQLT